MELFKIPICLPSADSELCRLELEARLGRLFKWMAPCPDLEILTGSLTAEESPTALAHCRCWSEPDLRTPVGVRKPSTRPAGTGGRFVNADRTQAACTLVRFGRDWDCSGEYARSCFEVLFFALVEMTSSWSVETEMSRPRLHPCFIHAPLSCANLSVG